MGSYFDEFFMRHALIHFSKVNEIQETDINKTVLLLEAGLTLRYTP